MVFRAWELAVLIAGEHAGIVYLDVESDAFTPLVGMKPG